MSQYIEKTPVKKPSFSFTAWVTVESHNKALESLSYADRQHILNEFDFRIINKFGLKFVVLNANINGYVQSVQTALYHCESSQHIRSAYGRYFLWLEENADMFSIGDFPEGLREYATREPVYRYKKAHKIEFRDGHVIPLSEYGMQT